MNIDSNNGNDNDSFKDNEWKSLAMIRKRIVASTLI